MLNNRLVNLQYQDMFFRLEKNKFVESNVWEKYFLPKKQCSQFVRILQITDIQWNKIAILECWNGEIIPVYIRTRSFFARCLFLRLSLCTTGSGYC